jgi:hypothetical protein
MQPISISIGDNSDVPSLLQFTQESQLSKEGKPTRALPRIYHGLGERTGEMLE